MVNKGATQNFISKSTKSIRLILEEKLELSLDVHSSCGCSEEHHYQDQMKDNIHNNFKVVLMDDYQVVLGCNSCVRQK